MNDAGITVWTGTLRRRGLQVAGIGGVLAVVGAVLNPAAFFQAYLMAYLLWLAVALGSLVTLMIHHVAGGAWLLVGRRIMEAAVRTLPLLAILFIPVILGMHHLFVWSIPEVMEADKYLQMKSLYLNTPFFVVRAIIYFAVWIGLGLALTKWSYLQDATKDPYLNKRMRMASGGGIVAYVLTATFASFDWMMSIDPHWFSSIYGPIFFVSQGLTALCFILIVMITLSPFKPLSEALNEDRYHSLGKWLFAVIMLWAYLMFSQFLIIWSGNLPEHIVWYQRRAGADWKVLALILTLFHFFLPFIILLSKFAKRKASILFKIAVGLLVLRYFDLFWLMVPDWNAGVFTVHWLNLVLPIAIGGLWLYDFAGKLAAHPLLPQHDPRFPLDELKGGGAHE